MRPLEPVRCWQCDNDFIPFDRAYRKRMAKFCSLKCWYAWQRDNRAIGSCAYCSKRFKSLAGSGKKFCSSRCLLRSRGTLKKCKRCGIEFRVPGGNGHYCSRQCYESDRSSPNVAKSCLNCSKPFFKRDAATTRKSKFCSRECIFQYQREHGGPHSVRFFNRAQYRGNDWPRVTEAARDQAGDKCEAIGCGISVEGQLGHVDHVVPYRLLLKLMENDPFIQPNDPLNLMLMCRSHHMRKTAIETRLFRGDIVGFISEVAKIIEPERALRALQLYGLH